MAKQGDLGWRVMGGLAAVAAGFAARKAIEIGWRGFTGRKPPTHPESPEVTLREAVSFAIVMGVGMELARLLATRAAARRWQRGTGELPAPLRHQAALERV